MNILLNLGRSEEQRTVVHTLHEPGHRRRRHGGGGKDGDHSRSSHTCDHGTRDALPGKCRNEFTGQPPACDGEDAGQVRESRGERMAKDHQDVGAEYRDDGSGHSHGLARAMAAGPDQPRQPDRQERVGAPDQQRCGIRLEPLGEASGFEGRQRWPQLMSLPFRELNASTEVFDHSFRPLDEQQIGHEQAGRQGHECTDL